MSELPEGWKTVDIRHIFNKGELRKIAKFLEKNDLDGLREYLKEKERAKKLKRKGILPDYMYYYLQYMGHKRLEAVI